MPDAEPNRGLSDWRRQFAEWRTNIPQREEQVFLVLTLVIGALVGLVVVAFIVLSERLGQRLYPPTGSAWRLLLFPIAGSLVTGWLLYRFFPEARGSGVPQTKAALYAHEGTITLRTVLGKFFCTSASLATGIPLGREGPAVQVGAGLASVLGRWVGLGPEKIKSLLIVGASAAVAAAFNTPLAAVLFSLEELVGDLHAPVLGSVVLSAATSWLVLRLLLGNEPLFHVPQYQLAHPIELLFYAVLGILGGGVSALFTKTLLRMRRYFLAKPEWQKKWQPAIGGLSVGVLGIFVPQVLGVGYGHVGSAMNMGLPLTLMVLLLVFKFFTVTLSYASGNAGGIFGPSLFLGAMLGGAIGNIAHTALPEFTSTQGAYALVGMGALFAGIIRAPMTSVIMIFEITHDYAVIVPLMIANLSSLFISSRLQPKPIYEELALQDGIHLPAHETRDRRLRFRVNRVMRVPGQLLRGELTITKVLETVNGEKSRAWPVVNDSGLLGMVSLIQLETARDAGKSEDAVSGLLDPAKFPHVHPDQPLELAMERMGLSGLDCMPVVSRANVRTIVGMVYLSDALRAYGIAGPNFGGK